MKLEPVTKLENKIGNVKKKIDKDAMSENCGVVVIFLIHGQFGAIWLPFILQKLKTELKNI